MSFIVEKFAKVLPCSLRWLAGALIFMGLIVVARFVLEIAGTASTITQYFSSSAAVCLAAIYLGAVAPSRGVTKLVQLILPSL